MVNVMYKDDLLKEFKRVELMPDWKDMTNDEKIDYILGRANYEIAVCLHDIMEGKRKSAFSFLSRKESDLSEFGKKQINVSDVYGLKRKQNERVSESIIRVLMDSQDLLIASKEQTDIVVTGSNDELVEVNVIHPKKL